MPSFAWDRPASFYDVPEDRRQDDVFLTEDLCVISNRFFFVRGCIEIPILGEDKPLVWCIWTSISEQNFHAFKDLLAVEKRSSHDPFFGWLSNDIPAYPATRNLKTMIHLRNNGIRPYVEVEKNDHPLATEQAEGITVARLAEIYAASAHGVH